MINWDVSQELQGWFIIQNQLTYYINSVKDKSHIIISIDTKNTFDKV